MPTYTPVYRGPDGWVYHDPGFTQPFTPAEMQTATRNTPGGSAFPGMAPSGFGQPQGNYPGGSISFNPWDMSGGNQANTGGGGTGGGWWNTFGGQTAINTGLNLLGGYLQNRAIGKAQKQSQKDIENRIRQALAALSPEHIMALAQQFLPQMAAQMSTAGQTAIQGVRAQAARTGQLESPRALSFEAGTRAKLAGDVQRRSFEQAFNLAGGQASAISGAPYTPIQPQTGIADAITNSINQAYYARARSQQPVTPYLYPWNMSYQGTPSPWEAKQFTGTPYAWQFNQARR